MTWGVSWGNRLFRIGQSPDGRMWGYINILGFRFFRYLDSSTRKPEGPWHRERWGSSTTTSGTSNDPDWSHEEANPPVDPAPNDSPNRNLLRGLD